MVRCLCVDHQRETTSNFIGKYQEKYDIPYPHTRRDFLPRDVASSLISIIIINECFIQSCLHYTVSSREPPDLANY